MAKAARAGRERTLDASSAAKAVYEAGPAPELVTDKMAEWDGYRLPPSSATIFADLVTSSSKHLRDKASVIAK